MSAAARSELPVSTPKHAFASVPPTPVATLPGKGRFRVGLADTRCRSPRQRAIFASVPPTRDATLPAKARFRVAPPTRDATLPPRRDFASVPPTRDAALPGKGAISRRSRRREMPLCRAKGDFASVRPTRDTALPGKGRFRVGLADTRCRSARQRAISRRSRRHEMPLCPAKGDFASVPPTRTRRATSRARARPRRPQSGT